MRKTKKNSKYLAKFDEINRLSEAFVLSDSKDIKKKFDDVYELLFIAYMDGWEYVNSQLSENPDLMPDNKTIDDLILLYIDGKDVFDRLAEAYSEEDLNRVNKILETEYHRIYNAGEYDRAVQSSLTEKIWTTMEDDRVRGTHEYLEGVKVPIDAEFITYDGDSANYPGGFSNAENNINCRCWLEFT